MVRELCLVFKKCFCLFLCLLACVFVVWVNVASAMVRIKDK